MTQKESVSDVKETSLGQRVRYLRNKQGITQIELAKGLCTPSMISQIESDRARPSFKVLAKLAERLEVTLDKLLQNVNLDLEATATYKMAMSMMKAREFAAAIPLLKELLEMPRHAFPSMELRLHLGKSYLAVGEYDNASVEFREVLELATFHKDGEVLTDVLTHMANLYRRTHEIQLAIHYSERAKDEFEKLEHPDPFFRANFFNELAALYQEIGKVAEAQKYYEECATLAEEYMTIESRSKVYLELAKIYRKSGDFTRCDKYASQALTLLEHVELKSKMMDLRKDLVLLKTADPLEETVKELLDYAHYFERNGDLVRAGETYVGIASLYLERGKGEATQYKARDYAEKARKLVPDLDPVTGDVQRILAFVCFHFGDQKNGFKHLKKSIAVFKEHELLSKLEEVIHHYTHHLAEQGRKDEAIEELIKYQELLSQSLAKRGIGY